MAIKKKQEGPAAKPAVSRIPMPPSDSALVIDLPDGQKLVIGKMEHGTVIEVATWLSHIHNSYPTRRFD